MALTKGEKKALKRFEHRASKVSKDALKLANDVGKELKRQMRKT